MPYFKKTTIIFASFLALILLIYFLAPVLQPFFIAAVLAYLGNPWVEKMVHYKIPRILAVIIVFLVLLTFLALLGLFLVPLIVEQIYLLIQKVPALLNWVQTIALPWLNQILSKDFQIDTKTIQAAVMTGLKNNQNIITQVITTITSSSLTLIIAMFQLLLILVVAFYLLRDWKKLIFNIRRILPRSIEPTIVQLSKRYDEVLRAFLRGQLMVMLLLGLIYSTGLWLVGLQFALLIGVVAGLLNIVPYLGFTIGLVSAMIAAYYQWGSIHSIIPVIIVFLIGQSIESMVLTPLLVGDRIGLHPVAVIFAVLTGGYLLGFIGALIALPVAAAIMVLIRFGMQKYYKSPLYS